MKIFASQLSKKWPLWEEQIFSHLSDYPWLRNNLQDYESYIQGIFPYMVIRTQIDKTREDLPSYIVLKSLCPFAHWVCYDHFFINLFIELN